jgi:peptidyl-prolyl cis-trans isomerase C
MGKRILMFGIVMLVFAAPLVVAGRVFSEPETVLAKVGDVVITQGDLDEYLQKHAAIRRGQPFSPEEKKAMLDNVIKGVLITQEAEKEKLDETPEFKSKFKIFRMELLAQEYFLKKVQPTITVTDEEVEKVYKDHPNLIPKETLKMKEILVPTEKEANAIYEDLKKGANFAVIASQKSKAETGVSGGNMKQPVARGQLPKELEEAAFNLKEGEVSKPIKSEKGFYILYLDTRRVRPPEEMAVLKEKLLTRVRSVEISERAQAKIEKQVQELRAKTNPEVFYDRIQ